MAEVALESVSKVFGADQLAVDSLDLLVKDREFVVLVGPSGCGKSTTLRMIAGLESPSSGKIRIGELAANDVPPKDRNIAMVFQNYALYPHMTAYENMAFGLKLRFGGWLKRLWIWLTDSKQSGELAEKRAAIDGLVRRTSRMLGIDHLLSRLPRQLSGGERQRVALGRAIVREPAAFLFDEPLSNLDAKLRTEMRRELKRLHHELSATMIYVTHDQTEAMTLGDRVAVMNEGRLQQFAEPLELYDRPANRFVAGFIGSPPMNLIDGRINGDGEFCGNGIRYHLNADQREKLKDRKDKQVVFGIRPEHVRLNGENRIVEQAKVEAIESLGDGAIVYVQNVPANESEAPRASIVVKTSARTNLRIGDTVTLSVDCKDVHLFDADKGDNLTTVC